MLNRVVLVEPSNRPNKIMYQKPLYTYEFRYGPAWRIQVRISPFLDAIPLWATWFNIWWVKQKRCLKVSLMNFLVFFIMMPYHWWQQSKIVSKWGKRATNKCGSDLKWICLPQTPSSNTKVVVHLVIVRNFFNLDSCLNKYLHKALDCNVWYTNSLHKLDPKKFSIATLKKGKSAYLQIFDLIDGIASSSERIIYNLYDVLTSKNLIVEYEGCIIPNFKDVKYMRKGLRRKVWGNKDTNQGGKRVRMLDEDDYRILLEK